MPRGNSSTAMATLFEAGSWIWVPDEANVVLPAKVVVSFKRGDGGKVTVAGAARTLSPAESAECSLADVQSLNPDVDNLTSLDDLNENRCGGVHTQQLLCLLSPQFDRSAKPCCVHQIECSACHALYTSAPGK